MRVCQLAHVRCYHAACFGCSSIPNIPNVLYQTQDAYLQQLTQIRHVVRSILTLFGQVRFELVLFLVTGEEALVYDVDYSNVPQVA